MAMKWNLSLKNGAIPPKLIAYAWREICILEPDRLRVVGKGREIERL